MSSPYQPSPNPKPLQANLRSNLGPELKFISLRT